MCKNEVRWDCLRITEASRSTVSAKTKTSDKKVTCSNTLFTSLKKISLSRRICQLSLSPVPNKSHRRSSAFLSLFVQFFHKLSFLKWFGIVLTILSFFLPHFIGPSLQLNATVLSGLHDVSFGFNGVSSDFRIAMCFPLVLTFFTIKTALGFWTFATHSNTRHRISDTFCARDRHFWQT